MPSVNFPFLTESDKLTESFLPVNVTYEPSVPKTRFDWFITPPIVNPIAFVKLDVPFSTLISTAPVSEATKTSFPSSSFAPTLSAEAELISFINEPSVVSDVIENSAPLI